MGEIEKKDKPQPRRRGQPAMRSQRLDGSFAPFGAVYLALLGLGLIGALAVYILLIAFVPGASGTRLDAMKTALLVVAGSGAGAGLYVQYRKQQTDEAKSTLDHANSRRDQDKLFTERYTAAVSQLGNNTSAAIRLGGVYALARIADDSERDRPTCLKVLCAYLRMPYDPGNPDTEPAEREVRVTAQTVIAERLRPEHLGFWCDAEIVLIGAFLIRPRFTNVVGDFICTGATFSEGAWFEGATFSDAAGFAGATFTGHADFSAATFTEGALFPGATFSKGARFDGAVFDGFTYFDNAAFIGHTTFNYPIWTLGASPHDAAAWFYGARFTRDVSFVRATFRGGGAVFRKAEFRGRAGFEGATFSRDYSPVWPEGFAEPAGIVWEPSAAPPVCDPESPDPPAALYRARMDA